VGRSAPRTSRAGSSVVRLRFSAPLCSSSFPSVRHAVHLYEIAGARKTTLARHVARTRKALHLRIDTIEQALRDTGATLDRPEGYMVGCRVAADNLRLGCDVVADSVNPLNITRSAWREVAISAEVRSIEIEVTCSDVDEHRARVESRLGDIPGQPSLTWNDVQTRVYEA